MIYCPKCGTANRDGSRFCNECGQRLGAFTRVKCPECGTMNPVQHAFCSECGGRLLPASSEPPASEMPPAIKGLSLPTKSPASGEEGEEAGEEPADLDEGAPAWLRELGARWPAQEGEHVDQAIENDGEIPDWLKDLRASLPDDQEEAPPEGEEVPEWLAAMQPSEAEEPEEEAHVTVQEEEAPDWLAGMHGSEDEEPEEPASLVGEEEGEVPDWLAEMRPSEVEEPEELVPLVGEEEGEAPDWLAELRGSAGAEAEGEEPGMPEAEEGEAVPDWLAEMRPSEGEELEELPPLVGEEEGEAPDWLAELRVPEDIEAKEPEIPEAEEGEVPGWLAEMQPSEVEEPEEHVPVAEEGEESPDWLAELRSPAESEEPEAVEAPSPGEEEAIPAAAMPGWLEDLRPPEAEERSFPAEREAEEGGLPDWLVPMEGDEGDALARAEIPEWLLALKPTELREEGEPEGPRPVVEEPVEETGLLAGLQGTIPVEMIIAQPRAVVEQEVMEAPSVDTPQARLFAQIVGRPPQAAPKEIVQPQRRLLALLPRWIIYIALIAAVTLPLLLEEPLLPRDLEAALPVQNLYEQIELLDDGDLVLVAFDYDPGMQDEMDMVARVLIDHLMERQAHIAAVSLYPAGPPVAQTVLDELAAERTEYAGAYGQRYVNLGYLPGQATAVRLMGQSLPVALPRDFQQTLLADLPVVADVVGIQDFALVVELAASEQSVRWWIEQAAVPYDVPLAGGVSASVAPLARPYYETESRQLVGLVGGLPDAAAYAALRGDQDVFGGALAIRLDSLTAGHLVFILVLAIGSVVQVLRGSGGGGR